MQAGLALKDGGEALTSRSMSMVLPTPTPPYMYSPLGTSVAGAAWLPQPCHLTAHCQCLTPATAVIASLLPLLSLLPPSLMCDACWQHLA